MLLAWIRYSTFGKGTLTEHIFGGQRSLNMMKKSEVYPETGFTVHVPHSVIKYIFEGCRCTAAERPSNSLLQHHAMSIEGQLQQCIHGAHLFHFIR